MKPQFADIQTPPDFGLFDCHAHVGPSDTGELYYPELTAEEYLDRLGRAGAELGCIFAPMREGGYLQANRELREAAASSGGRLRALARLGGPRLAITEPHLWLARRQLGMLRQRRPSDVADPHEIAQFAGVKLLPHLDGLPRQAEFRVIAGERLPVLVHGGRFSTPRWIARQVLPRLAGPLVIAHLGSFPCDEAMLEDALELARREPRVYLDTSGVWPSGFLRAAIKAAPEKLLFGSDCPLADPGVAWRQVASVIEDPALRRRIGRDNALEIFG